ncbi:hypothetical protein SAMN05216266_13119 [Amycolatopsis marina]|uniref:Zinc-finger n=1 Tax=Amycolatopsis marina TaxID=490629 RepID=A0A1I1CJD3_9PSEU|nr:hypothetical protein SAMN05216266_13119 [Amycolatopsis marina]
MMSNCPQTVSAGSYLIGTLDPLDHLRFIQHVEDCTSCKREITELLPVMRLLQRAKEAGVDLASIVPEQAGPHR